MRHALSISLLEFAASDAPVDAPQPEYLTTLPATHIWSSIEDLIAYRLKKEKLIRLKKQSYIDVKNQKYKIRIYENLLDG